MHKKFTGEFCLQSLEKAEKDLNTSRSVVIEGFANKAVVDRGNDLIPPEAWKTAEFERNPILFFNHDRNIPIGKALEVKVTSEGLKIKAKISKSKAAPMPYIRDMIREKVLRTFSVGFDPMGSEEKREDGVNVIKQANLLEVSVVSIPMNQESDFSLSKSMTKKWKSKDYDGAVADIFVQRGNEVLAKLHEILSSRKGSVYGFDRTEVLEQIAGKMGIEYFSVESILSGQAEITEDFIKTFSNVLMVPQSMLKMDDEDDEPKMDDDEDGDKGDDYDDEKMGDEDEDEEPKMDDDDEEKQAAGLDCDKDETEFGNPHLTIAKSHLALAGSMVDKLSSVDANLREMKELLLEMLYGKKNDEEIMPVDDEEAEEQAEEVAEEAPEGDNGEDDESDAREPEADEPEADEPEAAAPDSEPEADPEEDDSEPEAEPEEDDESNEEDDESDEEERQKVIRLVRLKRKAKIIADFEKRLQSL